MCSEPNTGDMDLTVRWGHAGKGGVTMPGTGRIEEGDYTREGLAAIEAGAKVPRDSPWMKRRRNSVRALSTST